jgi:hypothetical protein
VIKFVVEQIASLDEHAVYIEDSTAGNDRALFLVFNSEQAAQNTAAMCTYITRQYNQLFPAGTFRK